MKKIVFLVAFVILDSVIIFAQSKMPYFSFPPDIWEIIEQSVSKSDTIKVIGKYYVEVKLITTSEGEYESIFIDGKEFIRNSRVRFYSGMYNAFFGESDYYLTVIGQKPDDIEFICRRIVNNEIWYFQYVFSVFLNDSLKEYSFLIPYSDMNGNYYRMINKSIFFYATNALR